MTLDVHTLFLMTIYVEAILGLLLLFVWAIAVSRLSRKPRPLPTAIEGK